MEGAHINTTNTTWNLKYFQITLLQRQSENVNPAFRPKCCQFRDTHFTSPMGQAYQGKVSCSSSILLSWLQKCSLSGIHVLGNSKKHK